MTTRIYTTEIDSCRDWTRDFRCDHFSSDEFGVYRCLYQEIGQGDYIDLFKNCPLPLVQETQEMGSNSTKNETEINQGEEK
jgi:hypothetical protein